MLLDPKGRDAAPAFFFSLKENYTKKHSIKDKQQNKKKEGRNQFCWTQRDVKQHQYYNKKTFKKKRHLADLDKK